MIVTTLAVVLKWKYFLLFTDDSCLISTGDRVYSLKGVSNISFTNIAICLIDKGNTFAEGSFYLLSPFPIKILQ